MHTNDHAPTASFFPWHQYKDELASGRGPPLIERSSPASVTGEHPSLGGATAATCELVVVKVGRDDVPKEDATVVPAIADRTMP